MVVLRIDLHVYTTEGNLQTRGNPNVFLSSTEEVDLAFNLLVLNQNFFLFKLMRMVIQLLR